MKTKTIIGILLIAVFTAAAAVSGYMFYRQYSDAKASADTFDSLAALVNDDPSEEPDTCTPDSAQASVQVGGQEVKSGGEVSGEDASEVDEAALAYEKYGVLYEQNPDFVGWISIEGTNINYPVMQTPDNPDFYLKHGFDKTWSEHGVPYLDEACVIGQSNNLVIYGHHMSNGSMFCDLDRYTDPDFCTEHPVIRFDTLSSFGEYEVVAVFRYNTNRETFRYDRATDMDEAEFSTFMSEVHSHEIFSTGKNAWYGDELLTLSTCEYTYKNGRLVVVARKVVQ